MKQNDINKPNILFLAQLPPPVHGASLINKSILESPIINEKFNFIVLPLKFVNTIEEIGKASLIKAWMFIKIVSKLMYTLLVNKIDLVYFTISPIGFAFYRDVLLVVLIKLFNKRIVYHLHGKGIKENSRNSKLNKILYKFVFNNTKVITLSETLNLDIDNVYNQEPFVLNNGIFDLKISKSINQKPSITFVYLSNLILSKGIMIFLEAIVLTHSKGYDFKVKIIGNSADITISEVKEFIIKNKLTEAVSVLGPKYDNDKFQELATSDVFVFPTLNDCFPLSILEAMQMHLPVISTSNGAISDMIEHNINGFIVKEGSVKDLSNAMIKYIENTDLIIEHGLNNNIKFKSNYTQEDFEYNFIEIFNKILN
ncbi:glycosyltransferase involved in cell wall biosynthesis [Flavobacteriaceae bacterium MAR_2010_72]|nr:glycosyltransferase involved in cell wall biosynthesis [Flavobacteriaceae bacterium MAR_2010_72]TVZ58268.1 glycosyltransferase involved in cell wall biosynthesis [Flavobacteriaceae bacterium MAR_2010_105]